MEIRSGLHYALCFSLNNVNVDIPSSHIMTNNWTEFSRLNKIVHSRKEKIIESFFARATQDTKYMNGLQAMLEYNVVDSEWLKFRISNLSNAFSPTLRNSNLFCRASPTIEWHTFPQKSWFRWCCCFYVVVVAVFGKLIHGLMVNVKWCWSI